MYIDVNISGNTYSITIYRNGVAEYVRSKDMRLLSHYVKNLIESTNEEVFVGQRGIEKYFADCLEEDGVTYTPMTYSHVVDSDKFKVID